MSWTFDGTGDLLTRGSTIPVDSMPLWMSAWVRLGSAGSNRTAVAILDTSATLNEHHMIGVNTASKALAQTNNSGTVGSAISTASLSTNTWYHIAGTFSGGASRTVWLDGIATTNTTSTGAPTGLDRVSVGAFDYSLVSSQHWSGQIADVAIGRGVLGHDEAALLAAGFSPEFLPRRAGLLAYWPFFDNNDLNDYGPTRHYTLSKEADAAYSTLHPRIVRRRYDEWDEVYYALAQAGTLLDLPDQTRVLLFIPYADSARVCAEAYRHDLPITGIYYEITKTDGTVVVAETAHGTTPAPPSFTITGLSLAVGTDYQIRVRYENADGKGPWSAPYTARVADSGFTLTAITIPSEPSSAAAVSIAPDFALELALPRALSDVETMTGHVVRRLTAAQPKPGYRLIWRNLDESDRDTVRGELQAAVDAQQPITLPDTVFLSSSTELWIRKGRIETTQGETTEQWDLSCEVVRVNP